MFLNLINSEKIYPKKAIFTLSMLGILVFLLLLEISYLMLSKSISKESLDKKISFVQLTSLSDLAFSSEKRYIRHRSMSSVHSIYSDDATLREHSPLTYTISHKEIH